MRTGTRMLYLCIMKFLKHYSFEDELLVLAVAGLASAILSLLSLFGKTMNLTFLGLPFVVVIAARYFFFNQKNNLKSSRSVVAILVVTGAAIVSNYL